MEPQEKIVTETKYKTIVEEEPRQKKYTEEVERVKKRIVVDYVEAKIPLKKRERYTEKKMIPRFRKEWEYKNVTKDVTVNEPVVVYYDAKKTSTIQKARIKKNRERNQVDEVEYVDREFGGVQKETEQVEIPGTIPFEYTVAVPRIEKAFEYYTESKAFNEDVTFSWQSRKQEPREVTRQYTVRIPYIENIPRQYKVKVPVQVMEKGQREVPKQIPRTRYQSVKRDVGKWVTEVCTIPTYEIESDHCGCSTCCPKTRTVRKTVWQPNIVTSSVPYTVYETCLLYTSPSPRDQRGSRMPSSA